MKRTSFNEGWQFRRKVNPFAELAAASTLYADVVLPHDALIHERRDPAGEGAVASSRLGPTSTARRSLPPPISMASGWCSSSRASTGSATVHINGGVMPVSGRTAIPGSLSMGGQVPAPRRGEPRSRSSPDTVRTHGWYTGAGIYRGCFGCTSVRQVHLPRARSFGSAAVDIDAEGAVIEVNASSGSDQQPPRDGGCRSSPFTTRMEPSRTGTVPVTVEGAGERRRRSAGDSMSPHRSCGVPSTQISTHASVELEREQLPPLSTMLQAVFGIRTLRVDPIEGLRINGRRSSCAAPASTTTTGSWARPPSAAPRSAASQLLKDAGFNAIRSVPQPDEPARCSTPATASGCS